VGEVVKGINRCHFECACHLTYAFILGNLEPLNEALLGEGWDYQGIVDFVPVEEVKTVD
jgi:hypothetical protein